MVCRERAVRSGQGESALKRKAGSDRPGVGPALPRGRPQNGRMYHKLLLGARAQGCSRGGSTAQHSTAQHSTAQHSTAQHGTARHGTARHGTARHGTAQHGDLSTAAQHGTAQRPIHCRTDGSTYPLAVPIAFAHTCPRTSNGIPWKPCAPHILENRSLNSAQNTLHRAKTMKDRPNSHISWTFFVPRIASKSPLRISVPQITADAARCVKIDQS